MDLVVFTPKEIVIVCRALRDIANANGVFTDAEAHLVEGVACLHGATIDARALSSIAPAEVAEVVTDPHRRKRIVQLALVTALVEGEPGPETGAAIDRLAQALAVPEAGVHTLRELARGHALAARLDMARRFQRTLTRDYSVPGLLKMVIPAVLGLEDRATAAKYLALGELPRGTLGYALFRHYVDNDFKMPGEAGGLPERGVFHDVGHVLSGYGVDPHGEIQQAAFQAGFVRNDGFTFLLFGILQFHVGMRLTPIAKAEKGYFDVEAVLRAAARGASCTIDLSERDFDVFTYAHERVDALRDRWHVPPI